MNEAVSYDVYVKEGVDSLGRDEYGEAVAHFVERNNAVALKRKLVARGETVRVERSVVHGLSEEGKERHFSDYSRVPEYEPPRDRTFPQREHVGLVTASEGSEGAELRSATGGAQEGAEHQSWWWRVFGS